MSNVIIQNWDETPGERSLRETGKKSTERSIVETGLTLSGVDLRKSNAVHTMQRIAKCLQKLCELMAEHKWDDEKVCIVIGIQARNKWELGLDGEWHEIGSNSWLDSIAKHQGKR